MLVHRRVDHWPPSCNLTGTSGNIFGDNDSSTEARGLHTEDRTNPFFAFCSIVCRFSSSFSRVAAPMKKPKKNSSFHSLALPRPEEMQ